MSSIDDIQNMKAAVLTIMATRAQDQELVAQVASQYGVDEDPSNPQNSPKRRVVPCFGWHPWFSHQIIDDIESEKHNGATLSKEEHYKSVLSPTVKDEKLLHHLPEPFPLSKLISDTKARLEQYPHALVGEIGLDRAFRIPNAWFPHEIENRDVSLTPGSREGRSLSPYRVMLPHQKAILRAQLQLAGEMQRPVSIHSVQAHGAIFEVLQELWVGHERKQVSNRQRKRRPSATGAHEHSDEENAANKEEKTAQPNSTSAGTTRLPFPPRICMHSYSGPPEPLKQFLQKTNPADVYFSFSNVINFTNDSSAKVIEVIKALPDNRILVESDLHRAGERMDNLLEEITRQVCEIRGWELDTGIQLLGANWKRFIFG
ncbi:hypothetical protein FQN50_005239 [Emmonsiellopsis sp. PD_5]|nr:hypothetical protein FQN50_005239 [Emmonsiellopsis sp. PD_5]